MKHLFSRYLPIFTSLAVLVGCQCSEGLEGVSPDLPKIDVCVASVPGGEEICYESLKAATREENCSASGECVLPELNADVGRVVAGGDTRLPVTVKNLGDADLIFYNPTVATGSSTQFRIAPGVSQDPQGIYIVLEPGETFQFEAELRGNLCGPQTARWVLTSNDGRVPEGQDAIGFIGQPDNPIYLNLSGTVGGPCLCPIGATNLDFGGVIVGTESTERWRFGSCGDEAINISEATIGLQSTNAEVFTIVDTLWPDNGLLEPGEEGAVDVRYVPIAVAPPADAGQLWLYTDVATAQPYFPVDILGRGLTRPSCELGTFPGSIAFGQASAGATHNFRLFNNGEITCRVYDAQRTSGTADFNLTGVLPTQEAPIVLQPGEHVELTAEFVGSIGSPVQAVFTLYADDSYGSLATTELLTTANPPAGDGCVLDVQPSYGDFGDVNIGDIENIGFNLSNLSEGDFFNGRCNISDIYLVSGNQEFRLGDMSELTSFLGIPPGGMMDTSINVYFEPDSEGIKLETLRIVSNDMYQPTKDIPLYGNVMGAKLCVGVDGAVPATVQCGFSQPCDSLDFGLAGSGTTIDQDVVLTNCGAGTLDIRGIEMDAASAPEFLQIAPGGDALPMELLSGQSTTVTVRYTPSDVDGDFGAFTVLSNASGAQEARVDLRGNYDGTCTQIISCNPVMTHFGTVEVDTDGVRSVTCTNFGTESLSITDVVITGSSAISLATDTYAMLQPGENVNLQFLCSPLAGGVHQANIQVMSDACENAPFNLSAICNAYVPDIPDCIGSDTYEPLEKWRWTGTSTYPGYDDVWMTPVVMNLTDDNSDGVVDVLDTPDVIFTALESSIDMLGGGGGGQDAFCNANNASPAVVIAVSGDDGSTLWEWGRLPVGDPADPLARAMEAEAQLAAGDIDGDGLAEIIGVKYTYIAPNENCEMTDPGCCIRGKFAHGSLYALEHDGTFKWESQLWRMPEWVIENGGGPAIGDMNGDGWPEIAFGNAVFSHNGQLIFEGTTSTSGEPGHGEGGAGHGPMSVFVDLNGDGTNELVAGRTAFTYSGQTLWHRDDLADGLSTVANVDADSNPEVILLTASNDLLVLEDDGTTLYGPLHISSGQVNEDGQDEGFIATNPAVGDLDGDGYPEIVVSATNWVYVFEHDLTLKWKAQSSDQTGASGPTTFDFEGDGRAEVVYADEGNVFIWDGITGSVKYQAARGSRTIFDNPVIVDVDNNGHADILLAMESPLGNVGMHGIIAYTNDKENWVGTRRVWNQHSYHISNISESGIVPAFEGAGWLDHNVYRSNVVRCE